MISLGHFNWPIEAAVFNKNHYWASREYADRFWPWTTAQRLRADDSSRCIAALTRTLLPREKPVHQSQAHDAPHRLAVFPFIKAFPCHATHPNSTIRVQK